jgi:hypothetical protein
MRARVNSRGGPQGELRTLGGVEVGTDICSNLRTSYGKFLGSLAAPDAAFSYCAPGAPRAPAGKGFDALSGRYEGVT